MKHFGVSSNKVDEPRTYYTKLSKSERKRQISCINTHTYVTQEYGSDDLICRTAKETQTENRLLIWDGEGR